jgi:hypothetical protein
MNEITKLSKLMVKLEKKYVDAAEVKTCMGQGAIVTAERVLKKARVAARRMAFLMGVN